MSALLKYLLPHWRPDAKLKTRAEVARYADEEWALLVCQQRMTEAHQATLNEWYEGTIETDVHIPSVVGPSDARDASPVAVPQEVPLAAPMGNTLSNPEDASRNCGDALNVSGDAGSMASLDTNLEVAHELLKLEAAIDGWMCSPGEVDDEVYGPHYPPGYYTNPCRALVPWTPLVIKVPRAPTPVIYCGYTAEWENNRTPMEKLGAAVVETGNVLASYLFTKVIPVVAGTVIYSMAHLATMVAEAEQPIDPTVEGPTLPLEERGAPMGYMNSAAIAMELRRRFGRPQATPANVELGGRVAREMLSDRCGATRSEAWYTSVEATKMWLSPTLVDIVHATGKVGFC
nr:RNA-dependent RNA polymerase 1 [Ixeridium yellow mottle virus 2]